jgi:hypothetical protein
MPKAMRSPQMGRGVYINSTSLLRNRLFTDFTNKEHIYGDALERYRQGEESVPGMPLGVAASTRRDGPAQSNPATESRYLPTRARWKLT